MTLIIFPHPTPIFSYYLSAPNLGHLFLSIHPIVCLQLPIQAGGGIQHLELRLRAAERKWGGKYCSLVTYSQTMKKRIYVIFKLSLPSLHIIYTFPPLRAPFFPPSSLSSAQGWGFPGSRPPRSISPHHHVPAECFTPPL